MDENEKVIDPRLLQGAPLMPTEVTEDNKGAATIPMETEPEEENAEVETGKKDMTTLAAQGKAIVRQAVVSGRAEGAVKAAVQVTERTKEGIETLQNILIMTRKRLDMDPNAELMSDLTASQLELFWKFIQAPEFQNLTASLLAKVLQ